MRRMEQYFPVRWTTQLQVIRFQVSRENTRSNGLLFYLCLLALGLLDDSEVEKNDVLGEGDNITFIVRSPRLHLRYLYFPDEFKSHFRMTSELFTRVYSSGYAHISRSSVFSHYSLKLVRLIHCNNVGVRYFNRLSDRGLAGISFRSLKSAMLISRLGETRHEHEWSNGTEFSGYSDSPEF